MTMPMIVPIMMSSSQSTCPSCGKNEKTKTVCVHCNHEYEDGDDSIWIFVLGILACIAVLTYLIVTMAWWLADGVPLFQVFREQWEWMKSIRIR